MVDGRTAESVGTGVHVGLVDRGQDVDPGGVGVRGSEDLSDGLFPPLRLLRLKKNYGLVIDRGVDIVLNI
jgi:hypothetical protein